MIKVCFYLTFCIFLYKYVNILNTITLQYIVIKESWCFSIIGLLVSCLYFSDCLVENLVLSLI